MHGVNHAAAAHEEQALEKGVRNQMKQAGRPAEETEGQHHVTELTDRAVGQHRLMSVAVIAIVAAMNSVTRADAGDDQQDLGCKKGKEPPDKIDAGGDHRRRMDQRADRRGAFHRIGQPHVQGELGRSCQRSRRRCRPRRRPTASSRSRRLATFRFATRPRPAPRRGLAAEALMAATSSAASNSTIPSGTVIW